MPKTDKTPDPRPQSRPEDTNNPKSPSEQNPAAQDESAYGHYNSGRRAAGHGGGSLDNIDEFSGERHESGYAYSGGGEGHTPIRSRQHEADEELESRTGPYERSGRPAAEDSATTADGSGKKSDETQASTKPERRNPKEGKPL